MNMDKTNEYNINTTLRNPDNDTHSNHSEIDQVISNTIKVTDRANEEDILKTHDSSNQGEKNDIGFKSGDKRENQEKPKDYDSNQDI
jgi:hypothetical protein